MFNATWQYKQFVELRDNMPHDWIRSIVDFAENYCCTHQDEISAAYYTYSQATIHPVQVYYRCPDVGCEELVSEAIVIISDDLVHDHHAVRKFNSCSWSSCSYQP